MISPLAVVESDDIAADVDIGEFAIVRAGATIGPGTVVHPHAVIGEGVQIEADVEVLPGAFIGRRPSRMRALATTASARPNVHLARGVLVGAHAVVFSGCIIGPESLIGDGAWVREDTVIGALSVVGTRAVVAYSVTIGDRVKIMNLSNIAGHSVLEDDVFVGVGVTTSNDNAMGRTGGAEPRLSGPHIERGAAIGSGACLLPGVRIGANAIVGSGAVVTHDVAPATVVMGVPARHVRSVTS